jgi:hypothetical protein
MPASKNKTSVTLATSGLGTGKGGTRPWAVAIFTVEASGKRNARYAVVAARDSSGAIAHVLHKLVPEYRRIGRYLDGVTKDQVAIDSLSSLAKKWSKQHSKLIPSRVAYIDLHKMQDQVGLRNPSTDLEVAVLDEASEAALTAKRDLAEATEIEDWYTELPHNAEAVFDIRPFKGLGDIP